MRAAKRKIFKLSYLFLIFSILLFSSLVYLNYPVFIDKIYEEASWVKYHLSKKQITTDNYQFSYAEKGVGKTIVFVHGFRSDKTYWQNYIKKLGKGYHYIALDLPWHGETISLSDIRFNVKTISAALDEFLTAKKVENCTLVGASLGASFVLEYAHAYKDKVQKVILINPVAIKPASSAKLEAMVEKNKILFTPTTLEQMDYLMICLKGSAFEYPQKLKTYILNKIKVKNDMAKVILEEISKEEGMEKHLSKIKVPVLILQGDLDKIVNFKDKLVYQKYLPDLKYVLIHDGYHMFSKKSLKIAALEMKSFLAK